MSSEEPGPGVPGSIDVVQVLGQIWLASLLSGLRYWSRVSEIWMKALPSMTSALAMAAQPSADPLARAQLVDELRARLRELGEYPVEEARLFQAELTRVEQALASAPSTPPDRPYWRRWDAKA